MTIRSYLWGMRLCTLVALVALISVIYFVNPVRDGVLGLTLFYVTLFFLITGLATLFLFWLRRHLAKEISFETSAGISFRQGVFVAITVCLLLLLQSFQMLIWWDGGIVVVGVLLIELWFLSR